MLNPAFQSDAAIAVFSDEQQIQRMLDFEAALAKAQARLGIIPQPAAEAIAACCRASSVDRDALREGARNSGNLAIPLVRQLTRAVREQSPKAAGFVHWGATSQDAIDTGLILQVRDLLCLFETTLEETSSILASLCRQYRATPMAGRTWLQHAVPITFGLKTAGWLDALLRHRDRLSELKGRVLVLQFGGAAGTLASLGQRGMEVAAALAQELNLGLPAMPWHGHRDRVAELAAWQGLLMGTVGKIARDLSLLMQTEVAEVAEAAAPGRGGSSTMPHKRNPITAAAILANAIRVPGLVSTMLTAMPGEHERALGGWQAEWCTLPEIGKLVLGALETLCSLLHGLEVYPEVMRRNLDVTHGLLLAEAVSMALAETLGKEEAHSLLLATSQRAIASGVSLGEALEHEPGVTEHLDRAELDRLLDPANYLGAADTMIDRVLARYEQPSPPRGEGC